MAWGQSGGLGVDTAAADAYGGNRGEVETAGGMEMGGAAAAADLANALADALAGGDYYDPGAVSAQDLAARHAEGVMDIEGDVIGAEEVERWEVAQAAAPATGVVEDFSGYTQAGLAPSAYAAGQKYGGEQPSVESFGQSWQTAVAPTQATQTGDYLSPGEQERIAAQGAGISPMANVGTGPELFGGYQGAVAQGYNFGPTQQGHPDFPGSAGVFGTGVEDFTGTPTGTMGQGGVSMIAPANVGGYGLINQGATGPMESTGGQGAITAGGRTDQESGDLWAGAPAGTDFFGGEDVGTAAASPAGQRMTKEGINVHGKAQIDNAIMSLSEKFDYEAKVAKEKYGMRSQQYQKAQRLANTYKALDMYGKAYAATQGGSFIGNLIGGMPLVGALQSIQGWLTKQGIYSKIDTKQLEEDLRKASAAGNLRNFVRDLEGGPSDEDVQGPKEIRSFIQQYPWAAELDPKYIKYLIDNPAALQDLLGQGPGGGDQAAPGNQTKPGGGGGSPPAGFTQKPGAATQALVEWSNPATGETWTAPNGSWQGPPGWVQV